MEARAEQLIGGGFTSPYRTDTTYRLVVVMAGLVLRVKTKSGQKVVSGLAVHDKVSQLKTKLAELTGVPVAALHVLAGFPPKPIDLDGADTTIERAGIISGDTLIVEEKQVG